MIPREAFVQSVTDIVCKLVAKSFANPGEVCLRMSQVLGLEISIEKCHVLELRKTTHPAVPQEGEELLIGMCLLTANLTLAVQRRPDKKKSQ